MGLVYLQGLPGLKQGGAKGVAFQLVNAIDVQGVSKFRYQQLPLTSHALIKLTFVNAL